MPENDSRQPLGSWMPVAFTPHWYEIMAPIYAELEEREEHIVLREWLDDWLDGDRDGPLYVTDAVMKALDKLK